jgi:transcriptional regulator with XRE-family HTH domain
VLCADLRIARGQLAEMIGSSQRATSRYETVVDRAAAPVLAKLAKPLHVSADELLGALIERDQLGASKR